VLARLEAEHVAGLDTFGFYADFGGRVDALRADLLSLLRGLRDEGKTVAAYGAAAKGATMLNATGIGTDLVGYVVDRNDHKQGRFMPGTHQPILDPAILVEDPPDALLLLAWNVAAEIMELQRHYASNGARFIVPIPTPELI
jgi:hypothetical protein